MVAIIHYHPLSHTGSPSTHYLCRYGFRGFYDRKAKPVVLTKKSVEGIHLEGGTMLGTSRGGADMRQASHPAKQTRMVCRTQTVARGARGIGAALPGWPMLSLSYCFAALRLPTCSVTVVASFASSCTL